MEVGGGWFVRPSLEEKAIGLDLAVGSCRTPHPNGALPLEISLLFI